MTKEVLTPALEALETSQSFVEASANAKLKAGWGDQLDKAEKAITAIKEFLAQPQPEPVEISGVKETLEEGGGIWRECTGCYETNEGYPPQGAYFSKVFKCYLGNGCDECGGIGAIWDTTDYEELAKFMMEEDTTPPQPKEPEPCPDKERDEYACKNRHQCWEPCGELGKSEEHAQVAQPEQKCWCTTCRPITMSDMRFVVCPDCENKRCPKANDHRNACTGSNEVGQKGSSWEHVKPVAQPEHQEPVGVMVSMDVSNGEEPEHRIFGRIYEVQEDDDGVTYLAIEESRNFTQPEPVGTVKELFTQAAWEKLDLRGSTKVYLSTPPQRTWVGLTDDEIAELWYDFRDRDMGYAVRFAHVLEAKLKEMNT